VRDISYWREPSSTKGYWLLSTEGRRAYSRRWKDRVEFWETIVPKLFCENSVYTGAAARKFIRRWNEDFQFLKEQCECGVGKFWQGRPITLQIDHTNGIDGDHRIENLRFMCPNCHSQTETFCGRNRGTKTSERTAYWRAGKKTVCTETRSYDEPDAS
jgi:hypothetical protein